MNLLSTTLKASDKVFTVDISTPFKLNLRYHIDGHSETYYDFKVHLNSPDGKTKKSTLKVISFGQVVLQRNLATSEVIAIVNAAQDIKLKFGSQVGLPGSWSHKVPEDKYRLVMSSPYFRLDFKWGENDHQECPAMFQTLMRLVRVIEKVHPVDFEELGLEPKE